MLLQADDGESGHGLRQRKAQPDAADIKAQLRHAIPRPCLAVRRQSSPLL